MNFLDLALSKDITLLMEYIALDLHKFDEVVINIYGQRSMPDTTSDTIFKHATPEIQSLYYSMYKCFVHVRAILYSCLELPKFTIYEDQLNKLTEDQAIKTLDSGKVVIHASTLKHLKPEILRLISHDHLVPGNKANIDDAIYVLKYNPELAYIYSINFCETRRYNYEALACLIEHNQVSFSVLEFSEKVADHLFHIRRYLPNFEFPRVIIESISLKTLAYCISKGLYPKQPVYPHTIMDRDLFYKCLNYIGYESIVLTYIQDDWDIKDRLDNIIDTTCILYEPKQIERLYNLGLEWWKHIQVILSMSLHSLTDEQLTMLSQIYHVSHFNFTVDDFHSLVLYNEFFDPPLACNDIKLVSNRDLIPYKKGLSKLWSLVANKPQYVKLYCEFIPTIVPSLSFAPISFGSMTMQPTIDSTFFRFMNKKSLQRMNRKIPSDNWDIIIKCNI